MNVTLSTFKESSRGILVCKLTTVKYSMVVSGISERLCLTGKSIVAFTEEKENVRGDSELSMKVKFRVEVKLESFIKKKKNQSNELTAKFM